MKRSTLVKTACTLALSTALVACLCALTACNGNGIAAKVGTKEIKEETITKYIESYRTSQGLDDDSTFAQMLTMYGMTPETLRSTVIDMYVSRELVLLAADEKGLSVDSETIDGYVNDMKANFDDDAAWQTALKNAGLTEDEYRDNIEYSLLYKELGSSFGVSENPTDDEVLQVAKDNLKYFANAKRSSHILFALDDKETAESVLAQINNGSLDFAEAVSQYSTDTTSAQEGGDVGWDLLTSFVTEYQDALDNLSLNQVSELVESQYGYHIIKCTEVMPSADSVQSLSDLPEKFQEYFKTLATTTDDSSTSTSSSSTALTSWLNGYKTTVDVTINDMPKGLSYDIDMTAATSSSSSNTNSSDASTSGDTSNSGDANSSSSSSSTDASSSSTTDSASSTETGSSEAGSTDANATTSTNNSASGDANTSETTTTTNGSSTESSEKKAE